MNFKKVLIAAFFGICLSTQGFSRENIKPSVTTPISASAEARAHELERRLEEINGMDLGSKSRAEKRELRKEVRSIQREMKTMTSGGVYISVGSLIIIILLLIILL